jgi:hypothetical protein
MGVALPYTPTIGPTVPAKAPARWQYAKDLLFCISLAHLCVLKFWDEIQDSAVSYFRKQPADYFFHGATLVHTGVLVIVFWCAVQFVRRSGFPLVRLIAEIWLVLTLILIPVNTVRRDFLGISFFDATRSWPMIARAGIVAVLVCAVAYVVLRHFKQVFRAARAGVWILVPLLPITLIQTALLAARENPADFQDEPVAPVLKNSAGRIVVALFDELDLQLTNDHPREVPMPEWDRLRAESFYAERAVPTAYFTKEAIPGLSVGRYIALGTPKSTNTLLIKPAGESNAVEWKATSNLFSDARHASLNVGISGWYHPYCRLFGDACVSCFWSPATGIVRREETIENLDIPTAVAFQFRRVLMQIPGLPYLKFLRADVGLRSAVVRQQERRRRQQEYRSIHEHALRLVADPAINVTYLHYPTPHMLSIFDRKTNDFSDAEGTNYFDNLLLVDRTLGDIRRALEAAGLSEQTTLMVTADHPMRVAMYRDGLWNTEMDEHIKLAPTRHIPYVIKLAGQHQPAQYEKSFGSVVTKELVLAIATRRIRTTDQVVSWLDSARDRFVRPK